MGRLFRAMNLIEILDENRPDGKWEVCYHGNTDTTWIVSPDQFQIANIEVPEIFQSLTPDQIEKLILHAWELEGHRFAVASTQFVTTTTTTTLIGGSK